VTLPLSDDGLHIEPLCQEETVCVLPPGHRLEDRQQITFEDLADERLISIATHTILRYRLEEALSSAGVRLSSVCETDSTVLVANLVAANAGVAIIHKVVADMLKDRLIIRPLATPIQLSYGIIQRRGSPPRVLTERLVACLKAAFPA